MLNIALKPLERKRYLKAMNPPSKRKLSQIQIPNLPKLPKPPKRKEKNAAAKRGPIVRFVDTPIGRYLYVYAPLYYQLLTQFGNAINYRDSKTRLLSYAIETIAVNNDSKVFRTARFRRALIDFRRFGLRPLRKVNWTLRDALYFAKYSYRIYELTKQCAE